MSHGVYHQILVFLLFLTACSEWDLERIGFTKVITIGAIEVGSNSAFLIGDIEDIRMSSIVESGFVLSSTASNNENLRLDQPGVIVQRSPGMDTISEDRAFAARVVGLNGSAEYFFRAYVKIEGEEELAYGNIEQFTTAELNGSLLSVRRSSEGCPTAAIVEIQVDGLAPGGTGSIGVVYSTDVNNLTPTVGNGTLIVGENPNSTGLFEVTLPVDCNSSYFLQVVLNPQSNPTYIDQYSFTTVEGGLWEQRDDVPGRPRKDKPVSFNSADIGFINEENSFLNKNISTVHKYDSKLDQWTEFAEVDSMSLARSVQFQYEDKIYISSGITSLRHCGKTGEISAGTSVGSSDITFEEVCTLCPGSLCPACGSFRTVEADPGGLYYLCYCYYKGSMVYDIQAERFSYESGISLGRQTDATSLQINDQPYILGGEMITEVIVGSQTNPEICGMDRNCSSFMLEFNPMEIRPLDPYPDFNNFKLMAFVIGDMGYVGLGLPCPRESPLPNEAAGEVVEGIVSLDELQGSNRLYAFDPTKSTDAQWQRMEDFPAISLTDRVLFGFGLDPFGYVVIADGNDELVLWQFDPEAGFLGGWKEIGPIPVIRGNIVYHLFTIGNRAYLHYPSSIANFWMYVPEL